jgi:hypothetical protein
VTKKEQLARVEADLGRGHTYPALQRLASMVANYPDDLDVRAMRAAVNRRIGNSAEAGRWGFLTEDVTPEEIAAFERAFRQPTGRLAALRWSGHTRALGPSAAARLHDLRAHSDEPPEETFADKAVPIGCVVLLLLVVLGVLVLAVIGLISLIR